jgi:hypothetical protein
VTHDDGTGLDVLSYDECVALLARCPVGRVGVHLAGHQPVIFPVNFAFDDHNIVFRTNESSMLHRASEHTVAFEIDGIDRVYHLGWSVLIVGTLQEVTRQSEIVAFSGLPLGQWTPGPRNRWMRIRPETIAGRSIPPVHDRP